jgi:uncharacterized glyoxalase superfamily protein PhnB
VSLEELEAGIDIELSCFAMSATVRFAVPILPAADTAASLAWWTQICGFTETFRDSTPPSYAGISRDGAHLHIASITETDVARMVGDQTMVRVMVDDVEAMYAEYKERGGEVHPNGGLQKKPWGTTEFAAIDPNGVCVTFQCSPSEK